MSSSIVPVLSQDYLIDVALEKIPGVSFVHRFGHNPDIDIVSGFEAVWNGGGDYTGFNATAAETIEVFSSDAADAGTVVSSGTATGGSATTLVDSGATFVTDTVAIGDLILNDTDKTHGIVSAVTSETTLTVLRMNQKTPGSPVNSSGDAYRVVTPASTGAAVVELWNLLDGNFDNETSEFVVLNGVTGVTTTGTYLRNSRCIVLLAGSNGSNVGTITSRQSTTTANIFSVMPIGYNETMVCAYTIPITKQGSMLSWYASLASHKTSFSEVKIFYRHVNGTFRVQEEVTIASTGSSYITRQYQVPKNELHPGSDIKVLADGDVNDVGISSGFDLLLVDN